MKHLILLLIFVGLVYSCDKVKCAACEDICSHNFSECATCLGTMWSECCDCFGLCSNLSKEYNESGAFDEITYKSETPLSQCFASCIGSYCNIDCPVGHAAYCTCGGNGRAAYCYCV